MGGGGGEDVVGGGCGGCQICGGNDKDKAASDQPKREVPVLEEPPVSSITIEELMGFLVKDKLTSRLCQRGTMGLSAALKRDERCAETKAPPAEEKETRKEECAKGKLEKKELQKMLISMEEESSKQDDDNSASKNRRDGSDEMSSSEEDEEEAAEAAETEEEMEEEGKNGNAEEKEKKKPKKKDPKSKAKDEKKKKGKEETEKKKKKKKNAAKMEVVDREALDAQQRKFGFQVLSKEVERFEEWLEAEKPKPKVCLARVSCKSTECVELREKRTTPSIRRNMHLEGVMHGWTHGRRDTPSRDATEWAYISNFDHLFEASYMEGNSFAFWDAGGGRAEKERVLSDFPLFLHVGNINVR